MARGLLTIPVEGWVGFAQKVLNPAHGSGRIRSSPFYKPILKTEF
jgi:hypothetical protein